VRLQRVEKLATHIAREFGRTKGEARRWPAEEILKAAGAPVPETLTDTDRYFANELWEEALEMLSKGHLYQYPKADHTVDAVIFRECSNWRNPAQILLIKRGREGEPYYNCWALPGGFMDPGERLVDALVRELQEEVGLQIPTKELTLVDVFDAPDRDPRGRVISTAFAAFVSPDVQPKAADDAKECRWFAVDELPDLAFDHHESIISAMEKAGMVE